MLVEISLYLPVIISSAHLNMVRQIVERVIDCAYIHHNNMAHKTADKLLIRFIKLLGK